MKVLSDKFVLDPEPAIQRKFHDHQRQKDVEYDQKARQIVPVRDRHEAVALNPLSELLNGVRV